TLLVMWRGMCGRLVHIGLSCSGALAGRMGYPPRWGELVRGLLNSPRRSAVRPAPGSTVKGVITMNAFLGSLICAVAINGFSAASAAAVPQSSPAASDKLLDNQIEKRIHRDATLKKYNIDVDVSGGVATLTGTVPTEANRAKAATLAKVKGIARVDNKIVVDL